MNICSCEWKTITNLQTNQFDLCHCELSSNNPPTLAYRISQLTRYSRDYAANRQISESKVPISECLSWRKLYGRYPDMVNSYGTSVSQMTTCSVCGNNNPLLSS